MINHQGQWFPDEDYSEVEEKDMCDYDCVAQYVQEQGYNPKTTMRNLADCLLDSFTDEEDYQPKYLDNYMINIAMLATFVDENGGISEFDYYN